MSQKNNNEFYNINQRVYNELLKCIQYGAPALSEELILAVNMLIKTNDDLNEQVKMLTAEINNLKKVDKFAKGVKTDEKTDLNLENNK